MTKIIYTIVFVMISLVYAQAQSSYIYKYNITFKQQQAAKTTAAENWVKILAHTAKVTQTGDGEAMEFETTHEINQLVFFGKMEKVQFPLANIILLNKTEITNEQKDKLDKVQNQLETELKKSGK